jgi:hypothetical protein
MTPVDERIIVFVWPILSAVVAFMASSRGRSWFKYFAFSLLFSPVVGLLVLLVTQDPQDKPPVDGAG